MLGTIDLGGVERQSSDRLLLQGYVQQLVGQPFWCFRFSYGDELSLHFGEPRAAVAPKLTHRRRGAYVLGTRASHWYLRSSTPATLVFGSADATAGADNMRPLARADLESSRLIKPEARVTLATTFPFGDPATAAAGYALSIVLDDGASLLIAPDTPSSPGVPDEVADWELFTPHARLLRVGPGTTWSYLPSRGPIAPHAQP